jgi:predicted amidohydrolase
MKITLVQTVLSWESPAKNFLRLEGILQKQSKTDLVVLPEMFTTGFTMNVAQLEMFSDDCATLAWMRHWAKFLDAVITGSVAFNTALGAVNRLIWMRPDGSFDFYDKRHAFTFGGEHEHYTSGKDRLIEHWRGWNICPLICYDLRFPVWSRNRFQHGAADYDLLIYVANWPNARRDAWNTLLKARAIENVCYTVGVNRVGTDPKENVYSGDSSLIDFKGQVMWTQADIAEVCTLELNREELLSFREKFPALKDGDQFQLG